MVLDVLDLRVGLTTFEEVLKYPRVQNVCKVDTSVFVGEALIVLSDISKIVEVAGREFIKDLLVLTLRRVAVLFHEVVSNAESKALNTNTPVHIPNVKRKVAP